jgi:hypothetical protein
MNCRKVRRFLFGYFKGELSSEDAGMIKAHLESCVDCAKEAEQVEAMCLMLKGDLETLVPSADFNERLLAKIHQLPSEAAVRTKRGWWVDLLHEIFPSMRLRWTLAGAAGVLAVAFVFMFIQKQTTMTPEYMSSTERGEEIQIPTRSQTASDSQYAELMHRVAQDLSARDRAFIIDNLSLSPNRGEDGNIPLEDLYKRFVIERRTLPGRQAGAGNRYILPVVSSQQVSQRTDY